MTKNQERNDVTDLFADELAVEWMEEHLPELKQSVSGPRLLYQSLTLGFVVGLTAHIGGYVLVSSVPGGTLGLLADLLLALGWPLWTGVVVAVFVEVIPEAKRRQIKRAVDAYEALRRKQDQAGGKRETAVMDKTPCQASGTREVSKATAKSLAKRWVSQRGTRIRPPNTACPRSLDELQDCRGGSRRFRQGSWLKIGSVKVAFSRPAHRPSPPLPGRSAGVLRDG